MATLNSAHQAKKQCNFDSGWNDSSEISIAFSESCEPKRFARCWNKVEKNIFKSNNQISFTVVTTTWVLSPEWTRTWPSTIIRKKKWWWFPFVWMVDVAIHVVWVLYCINKDKDDESLPLPPFLRHADNVIFLKCSKKGRLSSSHLGIWNIPSDVCYDDTKHYQVQSEHRLIQNLLKHLRRSVLV